MNSNSIQEDEDMTEKSTTLEERMTPAEREYYERWKGRIGEVFIAPSFQERVSKAVGFPNLFGLSKELCWELVQRWIIATEDLNPLWFDEEYARKSKWGGTIVPPLYVLLLDDGMWVCGFTVQELMVPDRKPDEMMPWDKDKYPKFVRGWSTHIDYEFFEPMRLGDKIETTVKLSDVYWKQGKQYRLLFFVAEITYLNQKGQLLARGQSGWGYAFK